MGSRHHLELEARRRLRFTEQACWGQTLCQALLVSLKCPGVPELGFPITIYRRGL